MTSDPSTSSPSCVGQSKVKKQKVVRALLFVAGSISLFFGLIGIFLPLLPTTPFLLLTAACYMRSSERMYNWLLNNRWFGEYIKNYHAGRGIPLKTKIIAIATMWTMMIISAFFMLTTLVDRQLLTSTALLIIRIVLLVIAIVVSIHLIKLPTFKKQKENGKSH
jgi:uncharacterized membrane protein YbaN (DUF454 family)